MMQHGRKVPRGVFMSSLVMTDQGHFCHARNGPHLPSINCVVLQGMAISREYMEGFTQMRRITILDGFGDVRLNEKRMCRKC
jgi:hypothetical protein